MKKKKLLSFVMAVALLFGSAAALPEGVFDDGTGIVASAVSTATSGKCGWHIDWSLSNDGVLTISGVGMMEDYGYDIWSDSPFWYRKDIKSVVIESGITYIGRRVFRDCSSITSVTISSGVTFIAIDAFQGCTNLTSVKIPSSVETIKASAFSGCKSLTSVTIPSSVTKIEDNTFSGCSSLTSITIPNSVAGIGKSAFSGCKSLKSITIPSSVNWIDDGAFSGCSSLTSVTIPSSVTKIEDNTFSGCSSLTSITIPNSVAGIGKSAFSGCKSLKSITLPSSVNWIDDGAFSGCSSLTSATIPISVKSIGNQTFMDCTSLTSATIPGSVKSIGDKVFANCTNLTDVTVLSGTQSIGESAFSGCSILENITIPSSVDIIGYNAFQKTKWLENQQKNNQLIIAGSVLIDGSACSESVTIPYGVITIGDYAFSKCYHLTNVTIPGGVTKIGKEAFYRCGFTSVTVPMSVTYIGEYALGYYYQSERKKIEGFKIYCTEGSAAEKYAKDNGFDYEYYICKHDYATSVIAPTCTEKGYTKNTCKHCGNIIINPNSYVDALDHDYSDIKVVDPTCTVKGYTLHTCIRCGDQKKSDYVDALGHNYVDTVTPPNCTEKGYTTHICSRCNDSYVDTYTATNPNTHVYDDWITTFETTDTICGSKERLCKLCKHRDVLVDHDKVYVKTVAPTCTDDGYTVYNCARCGEELHENIVAAKGHKWVKKEWRWSEKYDKAYLYFTCKTDNKHKTYVTATIKKNTDSPTCTSNGKVTYTATASFEGKTYTNVKTTTLNKTGHKWGKPTWSWNGSKAYAKFICTKDSSHTKTLAANVSSSITNPTCTKNGTKKYTATVTIDGKTYYSTKTFTLKSSGHKYQKTVLYPTMHEGGYTTYKCSVCGYSYKGNYTNAATSGKCGDNLTWTFKDGRLTIKGVGAMYNWEFEKGTSPMISTKVTSIVIGSGVTSIGDWAFAGCTKAKSVSIPTSVKKIGEGAFQNCSDLIKMTIPNGVTSIGAGAFAMCFDLASVSIPSSVRSIYAGAFMGCSRLKSIAIPSGVTTIEEDAFALCDNLISITFPSTVNSIGDGAFRDTPWLTNMRKKNPLVVVNRILVDAQTYKGSSLTLSSSIKSISGSAFSGCTNLISISIPSTVTSIGHDAFYKCSKLKSIVIPNNVQSIGQYTFYGCTSLSSVTLGSSIKSIGFDAFYDTPNLKCITIPASVDTIDKYALGYRWDNKLKKSVKVSGFTIYGYKGSIAEKYAKENGLKFIALKALTKYSRLAGANRYDTAALISKGMYAKGTNTVIIATGLDFHDAMVAVPLASAYNAPLLLATEKLITVQTEAELKRLNAKKVIVVSTNGAIGAKAKAMIKALNLKATYIEGKTCFETAAKVAKALQNKTNKAPDTIFFATDSAFADALSASPVAAIKGAPILYLKNNGSIDAATANYLKSVKGKVKNAYIIGGDGVISNAMMKNVAKALGLTVNKTVVRVAGKNRYETCVAVNKKFKSVLTGTGICVAKGLDFPDALAGGVYAAKTKQALFLADGKKLQDCQNTYLKSKNAGKITVFGGTGAVPDSLVKLIAKASV